MRTRHRTRTRTQTRARSAIAVALVVCCALALIPTAAVAQADERTGGTVVVEEGETVDELEAVGGTVVVEGTVEGDATIVGGTVRIDGDVGGDLEATGGSVTIAGTVDGDVEGAAGSVELTESGTVGDDLRIGAGSVTIDGAVDGNAEVGADTIRLGEDAAIAGDLRYGGDLEGNTDAVAGEIQHDSSLGVTGEFGPAIPFTPWLVSAYALAANLLLGAVLLGLFPRFSDRVADHVASAPARSGLVGLGVLVGVPILLVAVAITVIGIPLAFVGAFGFALLIWVGIVYGRFAVAAWLLSLIGAENRWLALVVGLVAGALLAEVPYVGGLVNFVVFLLGLGALVRGLYTHRRTVRERERPSGVGPDEPTAD